MVAVDANQLFQLGFYAVFEFCPVGFVYRVCTGIPIIVSFVSSDSPKCVFCPE